MQPVEQNTRDVFAGLRVSHDKFFAAEHHALEIIERHISGGDRVVETAIVVALDEYGFHGHPAILHFAM